MTNGATGKHAIDKAPTWAYIARLWPIVLIFMALQLAMRLFGSSDLLGVSRWLSLFDVLFLSVAFAVAGVWVHRPLALGVSNLATGGEREAARLALVMIRMPWRALRGYMVAGLVFFAYLMLLLLTDAAMHGAHMTAEMILALGMSVFYGAVILAPVLGVAINLDYETRLRQSMARSGLFLEGLGRLHGLPSLTGSSRRPWILFIVTSLLPAVCLSIYVYLVVRVGNADQQRFIIQQAVVMLISLLLGGTALVAVLSRTLKRVTSGLDHGLQFLRQGHFDGRIPVLIDDDMGELARGLNTALQGLQERDDIKDSLRIASEIHEGLLPRALPDIPGYRVATLQHSGEAVGGDYYDHIMLPDGRVWLVMADVTGKGYPAALTVANLQAMLHTLASLSIPFDEAARYINRTLCRTLTGGRFVTLFMAKLQPQSHSMLWFNAGHVPPLIASGDRLQRLEATAPPMGLNEDEGFEAVYRRLEPGDTLLALTDGVIEARGRDAEMFGDKRLCDWFVAHQALPVAEMPQALMDELAAFGTGTLDDDATILCLRRSSGAGQARKKGGGR